LAIVPAMPIKWTISHPDRMVTVEVDGEVTLPEAEEYLDALVVAEAMPYAKLLDCTTMVTHVDDDEMMRLGARMRAYASILKGGPLVFVAKDGRARHVWRQTSCMELRVIYARILPRCHLCNLCCGSAVKNASDQ